MFLNLTEIVIFNMGLSHHPFLASSSLGTFGESILNLFNHFVWIRITDKGSVPEMRILSILSIKSNFKMMYPNAS